MSRDPIVRNALSIGVATAVYAVSFGVLSVAAGFSVVQTCVMSVVCFTGASQLTFVSVIAAGGGVAGALPPALLLAGAQRDLRGQPQGQSCRAACPSARCGRR